MNVAEALNLSDLHRMARRKLPRIIFDFVEGGVEDELCLARNRSAFERYALLPNYLVDVSSRSQAVELLGRHYDAPFGVSPMGLGGLVHPGVDVKLAQAAAAANIPYLMSTASNDSIEAAAAAAPRQAWLQIYATADERINMDLVKRARDLDLHTLVLTVDVPINSNRERNRRNGFSRPPKMTPAVVLESLLHPAWVAGFLRSGGIPMMQNWAPYAPPGASADAVAELYGTLTPAPAMTWDKMRAIRALWPGKLVIKGVLSPADAVTAVEAGANGIIVSNHGGRQLDAAPSPIEVLPLIKAAVGERAELILESGVRRGSDILIAIALGARAVLFGRPWMYGAAAGGAAGIRKVWEIMRREVDLTMGQAGCVSLTPAGICKLLDRHDHHSTSRKPA